MQSNVFSTPAKSPTIILAVLLESFFNVTNTKVWLRELLGLFVVALTNLSVSTRCIIISPSGVPLSNFVLIYSGFIFSKRYG